MDGAVRGRNDGIRYPLATPRSGRILPIVDDTPDPLTDSGATPPAPTPAAPAPWTPPSPAWTPPPPVPKPGPAPGIEYAGFWVRTLAYIVDTIPFVIVATVFVVGPLYGAMVEAVLDLPLPPPNANYYSPEYQAFQQELAVRMNAVLVDVYPRLWLIQVFPIVYFVGFWTWRGQTPGMMILGLRVAREADGMSPGLGRSILRFVGYWICWITLFIGFFWVGFDSRKQGWHDKIAGTVVVRRSG